MGDKVVIRLEIDDSGSVRALQENARGVEALGDSVAQSAQKMRRAVEDIAGSTTKFSYVYGTGMPDAMRAASKGVDTLTSAVGTAGRIATEAANRGVNNLVTAVATAGKEATASGRSFEQMSLAVLAANQALEYLHEIAGKTAGAIEHLIEAESDMDTMLHRIAARASLTREEILALAGQMDELAIRFGNEAINVASGALARLSDGARDTTEALILMEQAMRLSEGTGADLETTGFAIQRSMQAYNIEVENAAEFTNALFVATDLGRDSLEELATASLSTSSAVKQLGVNYKETLAATVALQQEGRNLGDITAGLSGVFDGLLKPSTELQKTFKALKVVGGEELIEKFGGVVNALQAVRREMDTNGEGFAKAFRSATSYSIALDLVNGTGRKVPEIMREMSQESSTLSQRIRDQASAVEKLDEQYTASLHAIRGVIFEGMEPAIESAKKLRNELAEMAKDAAAAHPTLLLVATVIASIAGAATSGTAQVLQFAVMIGYLAINFAELRAALTAPALLAFLGTLGTGVAIAGAVGVAVTALGIGVSKLGKYLEDNAGHAKTAEEAMDEYAKKTGMARKAVEDLNNTPPELHEAGFTQQTFDELKTKITSGLTEIRDAVKDGNKEAARSMLDDLMREYGKAIEKLPKPQQITLFGRNVNVGSEASDFATWYAQQTGELNKTLPVPKAPPGDPKKWSDILSAVKEKYQGLVDAENALAEAAAKHVESLVNQKAPLTDITAAVQEEYQHRVAALQATVATNQAIVDAAVKAKAPAAEIAKYRAEVDAANIALKDQALILDTIVNDLLAKIEARAQSHLAALDAEREARQAIYSLAVEMHKPEEEILARAKELQEATNRSAQAAVELAQNLYDAAKANHASNDEMARLAAQLDLAKVRASDMTGNLRDAHRAIKGMYETVKIDLPEAFRQGMRDSFAAVVNGTRKMSDVWKGVKASITGQFADAFAAIIIGKKSQFDDPMEKNLGGIGNLFGRTARIGQQEFGGLFGWIANGMQRLFGGGTTVTSSLQAGQQQFSSFAVRNGLTGTQTANGTPINTGGSGIFGSIGSALSGMFTGSGIFSGIGNWFKSAFPNVSNWLGGMFGGGAVKTISPYDIPVGGSAQVTPDGKLTNPSASASGGMGGFSGFSQGYGAIISALGAVISSLTGYKDYHSKAEATFVQIASQVIPVYGYLAYAIPVLNKMGSIMQRWIGLSQRNGGNSMAWSVIMNPLGALFQMIEGNKTQRDMLRKGFGKAIGEIIGPLHPDLLIGNTTAKSIVPRTQGTSLIQRAAEGLDTSLSARVIALMFLANSKKPPVGGDPRNPQQGFPGSFNVVAGEMQNLLDKYPDLAKQFTKEIMAAMGGGIDGAIDMVQRGIMRLVYDLSNAKKGGTDMLSAYLRLTGQAGDPFLSNSQGKTTRQPFGGATGADFVPTMQQAVSEIVRVLGEDMPRAIRDNLQAIVDSEFKRRADSMSAEEEERTGGIVTVQGKQISRAIEIEADAFTKLSDAFSAAGAEILKGATRRDAMDLFQSKVKETLVKAFSEAIGKGFLNDVLTENILAPVLQKLDRGIKAASEAETPKDALAIFNDLTLALGSDLKEIEKQIAAMAPLLEKYAKLQERIALAATSFDDVAKAAKELAKSLRGSIAQFTTDLKLQQQLATEDSRKEQRRAINAIERAFDGTRLKKITEESIAALSDNDLKRMPALLERARQAIVTNAQLELDFLNRRLQLAQAWASLKLPADDARRQVQEFGRQNVNQSKSAFESARSQMQQFLKDFRSEDEATRLAAAQNIIQAGPQLLELARQAGFAPGSRTFEDIRSTLDSTLGQIQKEAAAREVEALQLQREIKSVQDKALEQLTALAEIAKGVEAEARARQLVMQEEAINYADLQFGELQTHTEALTGIYNLLNRGINVVAVAQGKKNELEPLPGLSGGGLVLGQPRNFTLHPPELVIPLDRVGDVVGGRGGGRPISVQIHQTIEQKSDGSHSMSLEDEMLLLQQLRKAMRDPAIVEEIMRLARRAQQEAQ